MSESTDEGRTPEEIRQEIEATKERISGSVDALAGIKAGIEHARAHPTEVVQGKMTAEVSRVAGKLKEAYRKIEERADRKLGIDPGP